MHTLLIVGGNAYSLCHWSKRNAYVAMLCHWSECKLCMSLVRVQAMPNAYNASPSMVLFIAPWDFFYWGPFLWIVNLEISLTHPCILERGRGFAGTLPRPYNNLLDNIYYKLIFIRIILFSKENFVGYPCPPLFH